MHIKAKIIKIVYQKLHKSFFIALYKIFQSVFFTRLLAPAALQGT